MIELNVDPEGPWYRFRQGAGSAVFVPGLIAVALIGKILGGMLGAVGARDVATRLLIGVSMAPRGEVVLVIATLGFQQGHVSHHMLVG